MSNNTFWIPRYEVHTQLQLGNTELSGFSTATGVRSLHPINIDFIQQHVCP